MTNFSKKIPLARDSSPEKPRSWWDKHNIAHSRRRPIPAGERRPQSETNAHILSSTEKRRAAENAAAKRLIPYNRLTDVMGKVSASPLTAIGTLAGAANVAAARMAGDRSAGISVSDNGIQFESGHFGQKDRAFTLGNAVLHGPGSHAGDPNQRYDHQDTAATTAEHESGHTYQYQHPFFIPGYLFHAARQAVTGEPNPYEREADDFGDWKQRQKGRSR